MDVTDRFPDRVHPVWLEYGYGGDRRLYAEIRVHRPTPDHLDVVFCIDVERERGSDDLTRLARLLGDYQDGIMEFIRAHAPPLRDRSGSVCH